MGIAQKTEFWIDRGGTFTNIVPDGLRAPGGREVQRSTRCRCQCTGDYGARQTFPELLHGRLSGGLATVSVGVETGGKTSYA
jgi:hypothetical protein